MQFRLDQTRLGQEGGVVEGGESEREREMSQYSCNHFEPIF